MKIKKILVSQPKPASDRSPYYEIASKHNVDIEFSPFIQVVQVSSKEFRAQKIAILDHTAIVFTSRHAIDHFFNLCKELRIEIPETMKYFCSSEAVALYIQKYVQYRKRKIFFGQTGRFADLMVPILKHKNEKYFIPMSESHNDEIEVAMKGGNLNFTQGIMFRTVSLKLDFDANNFDMFLLFSPAGVTSLEENFPEFKQGNKCIGTFGKGTAQAVLDAGFRLDLEAPCVNAPSMTAALDLFLGERNK